MNRTLAANIRRLILATKSRFFALTAIVTIGVAFFVGVSATSPIMGQSVDAYNDETELKDITVYSNYGFDQADIDAIAGLPEVEACEGAWFADVLATSGNTTLVTRIHSFDEDSRINRFVLREGRLPRNEHEALAEAGTTLKAGFEIGGKAVFSYPEGKENESLLIDEVTIVGTIDTPLYLNMTKENSTLNNQYIQTYLYVPESAFDQEYYLEANVLLKDAKQIYSFSKEYEDFSEAGKQAVETLALSQKDARISRIRNEAMKEYNDGLKEYEDGLKEFNEQIADAETQISDGEAQIAEGQTELADGWKQYYDGLSQLDSESASALAKLEDAASQAAAGRAQLEQGKADFAKTKAQLEQNIVQIDDGLKQIDAGLQESSQALADLKKASEAIAKMKSEILLQEDDPVSKLLEYAPQLQELTDMLDIGEEDTVGTLLEKMRELSAQLDTAAQLLENMPESLGSLTVAEAEEMISEGIHQTIDEIASLLELDDTASLNDVITQVQEAVPEEYRNMTIAEIRKELPEETGEMLARIAGLLGGDENSTVMELSNLAADLIPEEIRTASIAEIRQMITDDISGVMKELAEMLGGDESSTFNDLREGLNTLRKQLQEALSGIEKMLKEPLLNDDTKLSVLMDADPQMKELIGSLGLNGENTVRDLEEKIAAMIRELEQLQTDLKKQKEDLQKTRQQIIDGIAAGEAELKAAEEKLAAGEAELEAGRKQYEKETADARAKLYDARNELLSAQAEIDTAVSDLSAARKELAEARESGLQELQDAKKKLDDAKKEIDDLKAGEWTVLDRSQHYASVTYQNTVDQMKAIGNIFPVFFILVAALVCLTTMTRLVDEQRGEIGTLRALGYTELQCAGKYLIYAGAATLLGEVLGTVMGMLIFPAVIYNTWRMMYILPKIRLAVPWNLVIMACVSFLAGMLLTTWYSCRHDMKEVPAQLMRPKAPKLGRKTMIERIPVLWDRLSFTWKVTMRNLFRYKRRFFMTVAGVAGCGALLVTGFGIRDSINSMVDIQFYDIYRYHGTVVLEKDLSEEERNLFIKKLLQRQDIETLTEAAVYSAKAAGNTKMDETVTVEIYHDADDIKNVYDLRTRRGRDPVTLSDEGVVINEKLAENLDLKIGDTIALEGADGSFADVPVAGITEMYIQHYVFFTEKLYEKYFPSGCDTKALLLQADGNEDVQKQLESELAAMPEVDSVSFFTVLLDNFRKMVKGLDFVVWTLIISSMSLAFVVLGNLINVNISERQREIATLKVLGFRRREVESYIYKENNVLTLIGAVVSMPVGTLLHHYIMRTVEMDYIMFGREVLPMSYVYAAALTLLFGVIVDHFMASRLHRIQMVESLKSVE